jgi:hypothetical protein
MPRRGELTTSTVFLQSDFSWRYFLVIRNR